MVYKYLTKMENPEKPEKSEKFAGILINPNTAVLMRQKSEQKQALTFDDITLADRPSNYIPNEVNLSTFVTKHFKLKGAGIISAAMDTVTEGQLALELAKMGGLGVIHRNMES